MLNASYRETGASPLPPVYKHRLALLQSFDDVDSNIAPDRTLQILNEYINCLEREFSCVERLPDVGKIQEMLLEFSQFIRSGKSRILPHEYGRLLGRLTAIYAKGLSRNERSAFSRTAADYADVIEAISRQYPTYDFSDVVGQLLYYMGQLFESRKGSWVTIYEHLQSMSDSTALVPFFQSKNLLEIKHWAEEGVANLFQIRRDILSKVVQLDESARKVRAEIGEKRRKAAALRMYWRDRYDDKIVSLDRWVLEKQIKRLRQELELLILERNANQELSSLIDVNISEFEGKLKEVRREYLVRLVRGASSR